MNVSTVFLLCVVTMVATLFVPTTAFRTTIPLSLNSIRLNPVMMSSQPIAPNNDVKSKLVRATKALLLSSAVAAIPLYLPKVLAKLSSPKYPVVGNEDIMRPKKHGTSAKPVQAKLRWGCDVQLADRICNYNRRYAEHAGYFEEDSTFLSEIQKLKAGSEPVTFYDSVTGVPLFVAPQGRSWDDFVKESKSHGWPSFRDNEVVWDNVRCLDDGETVSTTGTHLGHNLPDFKGNRYCINLVSVAGLPAATSS